MERIRQDHWIFFIQQLIDHLFDEIDCFFIADIDVIVVQHQRRIMITDKSRMCRGV